MGRPPSVLARALEPLAGTLPVLFYLWSALVAIVWSWGLGEVEIVHLVPNPGLAAALQAAVRLLDPIWIGLAALLVYTSIAHTEGLASARRSALVVFSGALLIAWLSQRTGFPFGPIHFTSRLGAPLGPIPLGIPLLWITIVLGARASVLRFAPTANPIHLSVLSGVIASLTIINLDSLAWKIRSWWLWYPAQLQAPAHPPISHALTWLVTTITMVLIMPVLRPGSAQSQNRAPSWSVPLVFNAVFLLTHAIHGLR